MTTDHLCEIKGDEIVFYQKKKIITASLGDWMEELNRDSPVHTPLLFMGDDGGTLTFSQNGDTKVFFVQKPETLVNMEYHNEYTGEKFVFTVAWPWSLYGIIASRFTPLAVCHYFTKGKLKHRKDMVYRTPLPNQDDRARLCTGGAYGRIIAGVTTYDELIHKTIHYLLTATVNHEAGAVGYTFTPREFHEIGDGDVKAAQEVFVRWEKWTKSKGDLWREINTVEWVEAGEFHNIREGFKS